MRDYIIKRLLWFVPIILATVTVLFLLFQIVPGDPIRAAFGDENPMSEEQVARLRAELGLDQPMHIRYFNWLKGVFTLDWGISFYSAATVTEELRNRIPVTIGLVGLAMLMLIILAVPLWGHIWLLS